MGHRLLSPSLPRSIAFPSSSYCEIMRFLKRAIGLLSVLALQTNAASIEDYSQQLPSGTNLSVLVQKPGQTSPLISYKSDQIALPASTLKVVTALAALLELGPDFHFSTSLESKGKLKNETLDGDLIARFSGDPTLRRGDLRNMVNTLKQKGIRHIRGNLVIDTSVFASHDKAPGWPWNDMTQCFSAPPAAAIVDKNCFSVSLYSASEADEPAFIRVSSYYPVTMFSEVRTLAKGSSDSQYCELDVVTGELNRYTLTGCMAQRSEPLPLAFAVQDGAAWAGAILKEELTEAGIDYSGHLVRESQKNAPGTVLAKTDSAPLHSLLKTMLKKSDNMIADTVFRTTGAHYYGVPGTWHAGSDAVRQILKKKADIDLGNSILVDGSGLSRHNLISARTMMQVLQYIALNDQQLNFISLLPLAGHDGTLQYRAGLHQAGVNGKVSAKTGALQGVYNLAGFITTARGEKLAFVQFLSGYAVSPEEQRSRRVPLARFESRLYKEIYQQY